MADYGVKDVARCPTCGSREIVYTCEPKCCFNHLCSDCRTTFQLVTRKSSRSIEGGNVEAQEPASGEPAAACAACESLNIAVVDTAEPALLLCASCRTTLELAYEDVTPDAP